MNKSRLKAVVGKSKNTPQREAAYCNSELW